MSKHTRQIALGLGIVWAAWWLFFAVASITSKEITASAVTVLLVFGVILVGSALLAWRYKLVGGPILFFEGLLVFVGYPIVSQGTLAPITIVLVLATLGLPPLIAGALFVREAMCET